MDKFTFGAISIITIASMQSIAWLCGINHVIQTFTFGTITAIVGTILGIQIGYTKALKVANTDGEE